MKFNAAHVRTYTDTFLVSVYIGGDWHEKRCVGAELAARFVKAFTENHCEGLVEDAQKAFCLEQERIDKIIAA